MSLVLLEHVNLNVPQSARYSVIQFYRDVLGCEVFPLSEHTVDKMVHMNSGLSQFHLPFTNTRDDSNGQSCVEGITIPQVFSGSMTLAVPYGSPLLNQQLPIRGPFGNEFYLRPTNWNPYAVGHLAGSTPHSLGFVEVEHRVAPNTSAKIAQFFQYMLQASISIHDNYSCVYFGSAVMPTQTLKFQEDINASPRNAYDLSEEKGYHICYYVDTEDTFVKAYEKAEALGIVYVNQRFEHASIDPRFGSAKTLEQALEYCQFRLRDIIDIETKELLLCLEQEVRIVTHNSCGIGRFPSKIKNDEKQ